MQTLLFVAVSVLAIFMQSFLGFGGALIAVPLFTLFISPKEAIPAFSIISTVVNTYLLYNIRRQIAWRRIGWPLLGAWIGVPIGGWALTYLPERTIHLAISIFTSAFALLYLSNVRVRLREDRATQLGVGFTSGLLGGSIAQPGPPIVMYGLAREWDRDTFRSTCMAYFLGLTPMVFITFGGYGLFNQRSLTLGAIGLIPSFIAGLIALSLHGGMSDQRYRQLTLITIIGVSVASLAKMM